MCAQWLKYAAISASGLGEATVRELIARGANVAVSIPVDVGIVLHRG